MTETFNNKINTMHFYIFFIYPNNIEFKMYLVAPDPSTQDIYSPAFNKLKI